MKKNFKKKFLKKLKKVFKKVIKSFLKSSKNWRNIACVEMGFPHLPRPPALSLHLFSCRKLSFGLGWICYCNPTFYCYYFWRLALCAFIRKYIISSPRRRMAVRYNACQHRCVRWAWPVSADFRAKMENIYISLKRSLSHSAVRCV